MLIALRGLSAKNFPNSQMNCWFVPSSTKVAARSLNLLVNSFHCALPPTLSRAGALLGLAGKHEWPSG
jgi:hypothetical protein